MAKLLILWVVNGDFPPTREAQHTPNGSYALAKGLEGCMSVLPHCCHPSHERG